MPAHAQEITIHHPQLKFIFEDSLLKSPAYHSALQPLVIRHTNLTGDPKPQKIFISPVFEGTLQKTKYDLSYRFGEGIYLSGNLNPKAGYEFSCVFYQQELPGESHSIDSLKLIPRYNQYLWGKYEHAGYISIRGHVYWNPGKWLSFRLGHDKHFIGDGVQSLFLSENAAAYPFFQTRINVWKINYSHQVMFLRDLVDGLGSKRFSKYASQHVLSYNATPWLNMYIFETVIWRKQDSLRHRGLDLTFLNPFLFFRPVEFNQGSPDNVIMGLGGKIRIFPKTYLYGQFLLDEFHLKEVKANRGWWGLKFGYQAGIKTYGLFKNRHSLLSLEYNQVRPFTYSHTYSLQNYGYLRQSLAHPLGSNFKELTGVLRLEILNNWYVHGKFNFRRYGTDPPEKNYGSDIYKTQKSFSKIYDNYTTQGILHTEAEAEMTISRSIIDKWRLFAFSTFNLTAHKVEGTTTFQPSIQAGLNTLLYE